MKPKRGVNFFFKLISGDGNYFNPICKICKFLKPSCESQLGLGFLLQFDRLTLKTLLYLVKYVIRLLNTWPISIIFPRTFHPLKLLQACTHSCFRIPNFIQLDGQVVGSIVVSARSSTAGISVLTVNPVIQNNTAGGHVQLIQAAYHARSFCLYLGDLTFQSFP